VFLMLSFVVGSRDHLELEAEEQEYSSRQTHNGLGVGKNSCLGRQKRGRNSEHTHKGGDLK